MLTLREMQDIEGYLLAAEVDYKATQRAAMQSLSLTDEQIAQTVRRSQAEIRRIRELVRRLRQEQDASYIV